MNAGKTAAAAEVQAAPEPDLTITIRWFWS